jgi:hypothetical protein
MHRLKISQVTDHWDRETVHNDYFKHVEQQTHQYRKTKVTSQKEGPSGTYLELNNSTARS